MNMREMPIEEYDSMPDPCKKLYERVLELDDMFDDMVFSPDSPTGDLIKCRSKGLNDSEWIDDWASLPECLEYFSPGFFRYDVKELDNYLGCFDRQSQTITIDSKCLNNDAVILHEMIHMHEYAINDLPMYFHDMLFASLFIDLQKKIPKLNEIIIGEAHILNETDLYNRGGLHDILFLLKSFDLDIRQGYPLGTVFGYGRLDTFKDYGY